MLAFGGYRNGRLSVANTRKVCSEEKEFNVRMAAVFGSCGFRMWPFVGVGGWGCPFPFGRGIKKCPFRGEWTLNRCPAEQCFEFCFSHVSVAKMG